MKKIFCFGELLLRLSPELKGNWIKQSSMPVYIGGAELNVATALAKWNTPVSYCTALPGNYLSKEICEELNKKNIDTSQVIFSGNRIGCYYLPQVADLKNTGVIYDRMYSSFSELKPGQIDWEAVLQQVSWFHFSAISPALDKNVYEVCKEALQAASGIGIPVSVDLNYRSKLWQYGKQPCEVMPELVKYCDLVMGNIWAANTLLGIPVDVNIHKIKKKIAYFEHAKQTSVAIMQEFQKCKTVANTFRFDEENGLRYYACLDTKAGQFTSPEYLTANVIDKVGSGDCFMAGLIYGNHHNLSMQYTIDFATAAAFNKLFIKGDATISSVEEIKDWSVANNHSQ